MLLQRKLLTAARTGDLKVMWALLQAGACVVGEGSSIRQALHHPLTQEATTPTGWTSLTRSVGGTRPPPYQAHPPQVHRGHTALVRLLIGWGADLEHRDPGE